MRFVEMTSDFAFASEVVWVTDWAYSPLSFDWDAILWCRDVKRMNFSGDGLQNSEGDNF